MKKLVLTAAIILGFTMGTFAQDYFQDKRHTGGLFDRVENDRFEDDEDFGSLFLPTHGILTNWDAEQQPEAPLGGGALLLIGFGAAYAMAKKNRKE